MQLGGAVGRHGAVVVEVVARDIGEGAGAKRDPVEPRLFEPVAGGFEHEMIHLAGGQRRKLAMQRHRVGGGQRRNARAVPSIDAAGRPQPQRSHGGAAMAERGPNLLREPRHRRLAVGAGDGAGDARLGAEEARRQQGEAAARIFLGDQRDGRLPAVGRQRGARRREDGGGAAVERVGDEAAPVEAAAGQGGEQITGFDGA